MIIDTIIEISKNSKLKYEIDKKKNIIRLDRILKYNIFYPINYGYIPNTLADDGDALDSLVIMNYSIIPLCILKVKPIGVLFMIDNNIKDDKICCVSTNDPYYKYVNNIKDINVSIIKEIEQFFSTYKKKVKIIKWGDKNEAKKIIKKYTIND